MNTSTPKPNAHHHPKAVEGAAIDKTHFVTTQQVNRLALACTTGVSSGKINLGAEHTKVEEIANSVQSPHDSGALPCPYFQRSGFCRIAMVSGWVSRVRKVRGATVCACSTTQPTRYSLNTALSGFQQFKQELETMTALMGHRAPTSKAAPAIPTTTEAQAHAMLEATTSASLAGFYLRKGNVIAARRKAVQLLKSLQVLEVSHV